MPPKKQKDSVYIRSQNWKQIHEEKDSPNKSKVQKKYSIETRSQTRNANLSAEQKWNRQSQIGTKSKIMKQFQRYFQNDTNVFYEETPLMKQNQMIDYCWRKVLVVFLVCFSFWFALNSIAPYEKDCPRHATCGAYVHCHEGYVLKQTPFMCEVDPAITQSAIAIMSSVIQQMKLQYGRKYCSMYSNMTTKQIQQQLKPPRKSFNDIFEELDIDSQVLKTELVNLFNNRDYQQIGNFSRDNMGAIVTGQKILSLTCRMNIFSNEHMVTFIIVVILLCIIGVFFSIWLYNQLYYLRGKRIYDYLKLKTKEHTQIDIEMQTEEIEKKNFKRPVSPELWMLINECRIKQKLIGSYQDDSIKWKWL